MGILDKLKDRARRAGDLTDDASQRRLGHREEEKVRKEHLERARERMEARAFKVTALERKT